MPELPIIAFTIRVAPTGGFIEGVTNDGTAFQHGQMDYALTAAIAAVLKGPNPSYDHQHHVFVSSGSRAAAGDPTFV